LLEPHQLLLEYFVAPQQVYLWVVDKLVYSSGDSFGACRKIRSAARCNLRAQADKGILSACPRALQATARPRGVFYPRQRASHCAARRTAQSAVPCLNRSRWPLSDREVSDRISFQRQRDAVHAGQETSYRKESSALGNPGFGDSVEELNSRSRKPPRSKNYFRRLPSF